MLKFSANLSMMFTETEDAIGRMKPAAEAGFEGVEYLFVYDMDLERMKGEAERLGLGWSVVNIAVGEGVKPGPQVAAAPGKEAAFRENLAAAKKYCAAPRACSTS